jgi:hypothetical protein
VVRKQFCIEVITSSWTTLCRRALPSTLTLRRQSIQSMRCCDIPTGTRVLFEKPLLMIPDNMPDAEPEKRLTRDLKALNKEQQRQYLSLHKNYGSKRIFCGIFKTNSAPYGTDSFAIAVSLTISLVYHSCLPNSHYTWNDLFGNGDCSRHSHYQRWRGDNHLLYRLLKHSRSSSLSQRTSWLRLFV